MIQAAESVLELVGNTPLVRCNKLATHVKANIYLKLEYMNPGGSVKDRPALQMIADAEASGELLPGGTIIEATSGNALVHRDLRTDNMLLGPKIKDVYIYEAMPSADQTAPTPDPAAWLQQPTAVMHLFGFRDSEIDCKKSCRFGNQVSKLQNFAIRNPNLSCDGRL